MHKKITNFNFRLFFWGNVRQQLIITFLLLTIIPIFFMGFLSISSTRKQILSEHESAVDAEVTRIKSTLFDITTSMYTSCEPVLSQDTYKSLLSTDSYSTENESQYDSLTNTLNSMHANTAAISSICVYTNNPNIPENSYITCMPDGFDTCEWYQNIDPILTAWSNWSCSTQSSDSRNHTTSELTLSRRFALSSGSYSAYIVITVSNNYLRNRLLYTDYFILACIDDNPVFFSSESNWLQSEFPFEDDFNGGYYQYNGPVVFDNKEEMTAVSTFAPYRTNVKFYILAADKNAYDGVSTTTWILFLIYTIAWVVPTIFILIFSNYFSSRINILRTAMHQASLGDYNIVNNFKGNDELGQTFLDLKTTVDTIREKEICFYEDQIARQQMINKQQQMEFKMLASQINPHFLYNTLEMIHMQALGNKDRDVATSINLLGKSMHYVLENTGTNATTLEKELEYIKSYLRIQQLRFGDRVNYEFDIDPSIDLSHCKILPLLLQPIVENAVVHGLEGMKINGLITIFIGPISNNQIKITVSDNGDGMDEQALADLNERIHSKEIDGTSSIGLYNINQRIQLLYGDECSLLISSELHHGTTVTMILPQDYMY